LLGGLLQNTGVEVIPARTGREAFSLAVKLRPDLVAARPLLPDVCAGELRLALSVHPMTRDTEMVVFDSPQTLIARVVVRIKRISPAFSGGRRPVVSSRAR